MTEDIAKEISWKAYLHIVKQINLQVIEQVHWEIRDQVRLQITDPIWSDLDES